MIKLKINALLLTILLWCLSLFGQNSEGYNYCEGEVDTDLCGQNHKHFICEIDEAIPKKGELLANVPFTNKILRILLERHNEIRNITAIGSKVDTRRNITVKRHISSENALAYTASNENMYSENKRSKRSVGFLNEPFSDSDNNKFKNKPKFVTQMSFLSNYNDTDISINETYEKLPEQLFLTANPNDESITNNDTKNMNSTNTTKVLRSIKNSPNDSLLETNKNKKNELRFPEVIPLPPISEKEKQSLKEIPIDKDSETDRDRIFFHKFISPHSKNGTDEPTTRRLSRDIHDSNQKFKLRLSEVIPSRPTSKNGKQTPKEKPIDEDSQTIRDRILFPEFISSHSKNDKGNPTLRGLTRDTNDPNQKGKLGFPELTPLRPTSEEEKQVSEETPFDEDPNTDQDSKNDTDELNTKVLSKDINDANAKDNLPPKYIKLRSISSRIEVDPSIEPSIEPSIDPSIDSSNDDPDQTDPENRQEIIVATRMRELIWDNELAYLARKHAGQCNSSPVQCHNTSRFHHTGMNLGVLYGENKLPIELVINRTIENWYLTWDNEGNLKDIAAGTNYHETAKPFATIIHEYTTRLGCAIAYCTECEIDQESVKQKHCYFVTCLYDMTYMPQHPVYKFGNQTSDVASECEDWSAGKSRNYENLCNNNGRIFPIT